MTRWQSWDARLRAAGPWHTRVDHPDGSKSVVWGRHTPYDGRGDHALEDLIYGPTIAGMAPGELIIVTEGEKAADAVRSAGYPAAGTVCGASATPGRAVVALLARFRVALWPDADVVGRAHMGRLGRALESAGVPALGLVRWPDAPEHGDAADLSRAGVRDRLARVSWIGDGLRHDAAYWQVVATALIRTDQAVAA